MSRAQEHIRELLRKSLLIRMLPAKCGNRMASISRDDSHIVQKLHEGRARPVRQLQ